MDKKVRQFKIDYNLDWEYGVEIKKLREDLEALEELGATRVDIDSSVSYDCAYITIQAFAERMETDEEYQARIDQEQRRKDEIKTRELDQLQVLLEKYGK